MKRSDFLLRLIILEKAVLSLLAVVLSAGILTLVNRDLGAMVLNLGRLLNLQDDNRFLLLALSNVTNTTNSTLIGVSVIGFVYAALNSTEAWGLHRRYRWAEYLTVIATALFIPFELHEVIVKPTLIRFSALIINILIVLFLARHKEMFPRRLNLFKFKNIFN